MLEHRGSVITAKLQAAAILFAAYHAVDGSDLKACILHHEVLRMLLEPTMKMIEAGECWATSDPQKQAPDFHGSLGIDDSTADRQTP